jgi:hypothetical protein
MHLALLLLPRIEYVMLVPAKLTQQKASEFAPEQE